MAKVLRQVPKSPASTTNLEQRVVAFGLACIAADVSVCTDLHADQIDAVVCFGLVPMRLTAVKLALENPGVTTYVVTGISRKPNELKLPKNVQLWHVTDDPAKGGALEAKMHELVAKI